MNLLLQTSAKNLRKRTSYAKLLTLTSLLLILTSINCLVLAQTKVWDKSFGGVQYEHPSEEGDYFDGRNGYSYGTAMLVSADGSYIITGDSDSNAGGDKSEASPGEYYTPDNQGYWSGNRDFWIVKMNADGEKIWEKTMLSDMPDEELKTIINTPDGGYLLAGHSGYEGYAIRIDGLGNLVWKKSYMGAGTSGSSLITSASVTSDGGFLLGGYSNEEAGKSKSQPSRGSFDYWVLKIDKDGNRIWDKTIGGSGIDYLYSLIPATDGGYLLGGTSSSAASGEKSARSYGDDFWLVKIDTSGAVLWDKTFGGTSRDGLSTMLASEDGGYVLGGTSTSPKSRDKSENSRDTDFYIGDYWLVKIDNTGKKIWDKTFGGESADVLSSVMITSDGGYLLGGTSRSAAIGEKSEESRDPDFYKGDFWIVKVNALGTKIWDKTLGGSAVDNLTGMLPVSDGSFMLGGYSESVPGHEKSAAQKGFIDYWVVKISTDPLPVTLASFSAKKEGSNALLQWTTASEMHSNRFEIEHSTDAKSWKMLDAVAANGESRELKNYDYVHASPETGTENLYRLKMIDADGSHAYSKMCSIIFPSAFVIYPNPVSETLHVQTATNKILHVELLNNSLIPVYDSGKNFSEKIDISRLRAGIYILKISQADGSHSSQQIVITR